MYTHPCWTVGSVYHTNPENTLDASGNVLQSGCLRWGMINGGMLLDSYPAVSIVKEPKRNTQTLSRHMEPDQSTITGGMTRLTRPPTQPQH